VNKDAAKHILTLHLDHQCGYYVDSSTFHYQSDQ